MPIALDIKSTYKGPRELPEDVDSALTALASTLLVSHSKCKTHHVLKIDSFDHPSALAATSVYLVSCIAQTIEANLQVRKALFDEGGFTRDLYDDVVSVIGNDSADDEFKTMVRNPWMWEAISHLIVHLSRLNIGFHPVGQVLTKTTVKHDVHDHGLDLIVIYRASVVGITAGECKAYLNNPAKGITDATGKLGEVDSNKRDMEIRAVVNQMRSALDKDTQKELAGSFWKNERTYIPFVCCDDTKASDWKRNRNSLNQLRVPVNRKLLVPLSLPNAKSAFDNICEGMRFYSRLEEGI